MNIRNCCDLEFLSLSNRKAYSINSIPNRILVFSKYARFKINIYKSVDLLQTNHNQLETYKLNKKFKEFIYSIITN